MGNPSFPHAAKQEMVRLLLNEGQPFTRDRAIHIVSKIELAINEAYQMGKNEGATLGRLPTEPWDAQGQPGNRGRDDWGSKRGY